jgi:selenocysteine lyase/cysteine desulfurase
VKIPIAAIGELVTTVNKGRKEDDRLLYCVDGVHGFGVDDIQFDDIGCDYFVAGTHKWMFGPSGTGIMCSRDVDMQTISPTIPAFNFSDDPSFGPTMTPGGFHSFEHRWALHRAFQFHLQIGKRKIQDRIRELNTYLKTRLDDAPNVELMTPMSTELSAGFTFFGVDGMDPEMVTEQLLAQQIVVSPADRDVGPVVRMAPGLLNNHGEIDHVMTVLAKLPRV